MKDFDPAQVVPAKEARKLERNVLFGVAAGREALADAGLNGFDPTRVGIVFGSAIGGVPGILEQADTLRERGPDRVSPNFLQNVLVDSVSGQLAISLGIKGPNYAVVSACATGSHAVGEAAEMIKRGAADAVLAGGTESCIVPLILAGFTAMRGLAVEDDDPTRASRPFDATRAGFVMAEGAGALLLEDWETAERRGAEIYAEVLGYGASNDAHHMAQPEPEATGVAAMMAGALERAGVDRERVGYINAHGTSTPLGDAAETKAIREVFGAHADELAVSSTKSMMGHTFGAAGAVEAIMCALALRDGVLPPTINYRSPIPTCDLDYVPERGASRGRRRGALERDGARRPQRLRAARPRRMTLTLVRNACLLLETGGRRLLVDPMLRAAGTTPPIENTPNQVPNPLVELPFPAEEVVAGIDGCIVTHLHGDHFDDAAAELLPRDLPLLTQPESAAALRERGFTHVEDSYTGWLGLDLALTRGRHGTGEIGAALGPVSGFVVDGLYVAGDTIWCDEVREATRAAPPAHGRRQRGRRTLQRGRSDRDDGR